VKITLPPALKALIHRLRYLRGTPASPPDTNTAPQDPAPVSGLLPAADEEALIDALILRGWEQGCWLDDSVAAHSLNARQQRALFAATAERPVVHREQHLAAQGHSIPETLPQNPDQPDDIAWVIVTQRCDLIKGLRHEPTVALVRATRWTVQEAKEKQRTPYLYTVRTQGDSAWVADFREMITIPKAVLREYQPRQCLGDGMKPRRRFALAYAQRTWRRPVPTDIQQKVQAPLINMRKRWRDEFYKHISDILIDVAEHTGKLVVYAVIGDDQDDEGESLGDLEIRLSRFFDETVLAYLVQQSGDIFDDDASAVIPAEQLTMTRVFRTYKLDLNYLSSGDIDASPQL